MLRCALFRFTAGGNIATTLTVLALIASGFMLHRAMEGDGDMRAEAGLLTYQALDVRGVPVSLGVMAYCE